MSAQTPLNTSHSAILRLSIPIILANAAVPLLGLTDTAVIGHFGDTAALGAIALGSLVFSFIFWAFGFLRMGTSGFTAQAMGAGDWAEVKAACLRALLLGCGIGLGLLLLQWPIFSLALWLLDASNQVENQMQDYMYWRIWGAPACLGIYALWGTLIGLGQTRKLLALQLLLNGLNVLLDVYLVAYVDMGVAGIALGTALAEWISFLLGLLLVLRILNTRYALFDWPSILHPSALLATLQTNAAILWRTLFLLAGFAWFANQGARFGDSRLAANHLLLQFISFSAFFLDGFAFALESLVGRALGAQDKLGFKRALINSSHIAALSALALMASLLVWGEVFIHALTPLAQVREQALAVLPFAAIYVLVSFAAFQLDGLFIGAIQSRAMRNASAMSLAIFLVLGYCLVPVLGNTGLWLAFIAFVIARALCLGFYLPAILRRFSA